MQIGQESLGASYMYACVWSSARQREGRGYALPELHHEFAMAHEVGGHDSENDACLRALRVRVLSLLATTFSLRPLALACCSTIEWNIAKIHMDRYNGRI